ncbi:MAG: hypothetical protein QM679_11635 [Patulibacter sp.]
MADSDSSDVLANLPAGRPARRSSRRVAATSDPAAASKPAATAKPAAKQPSTAAKNASAKKSTPRKPAATAKPSAKKPAARTPATTSQTAAKKPATGKAPAAKTPAATSKQPSMRQPRTKIATPPEGRRADYSGSATHRARKVTTNRPWLPSSGFVLPEDKQANQLATALGGLGSALADVARLSFGVAQSIAVRRREIEAPEAVELTSDE